jgi:autotransporter-associated beta strand protein
MKSSNQAEGIEFSFRYRANTKSSAPTVRSCRQPARPAVSEPLESRCLLSVAVWTGAVNYNWSNPGNWQGDQLPAAGEDVTFPNSIGPNGGPTTITLSSNVTVGNLNLDGDYVIEGASITLDGGVVVDSYSTIENAVLGHEMTIDVPSDGNLTLMNPSDGGNHFGILEDGTRGAGTINMTGSGATYTGLTEVAAGTLNVECPLASPVQIDSSATLAASPGEADGITAEAGGDVLLLPSNQLSSADGLTLNPGSTLTETGGFASEFGEITVSSGAINLTGSTLDLSEVNAGYIPANTVMTLISNLTGSPVIGTFAGFPAGRTVESNHRFYQISYTGGASGHDVTLNVLASLAVWTGASGDGQWSNAGNWEGGAVPMADQSVEFPATSSGTTDPIFLSQNVQVGDLEMDGSYFIQNDTLTVDGNVSADDDKIGSNLVLSAANSIITVGTSLDLLGADSGTGGGVVLNPDPDYEAPANGFLYIGGTANSVGQIVVNSGGLFVDGTTTSDIQLAYESSLGGTGTVGGISSGFQGNEEFDSDSLTSTGPVTFGSQYYVEIPNGSAPSRLNVLGTDSAIDLNGAGLSVTLDSGAPIPYGHTFTLISNQTGSPVTGIFHLQSVFGQAITQGAIFSSNGISFQIGYTGGASGQDVTLTVVKNPATISLTSSHLPVYQGEHVTLKATIAASGTPTGTVTFYDGGKAIGTASLGGTAATFNDTTLPVGFDSITATYSGDANLASATTASSLVASVRAFHPGAIPTITTATSTASTNGRTIVLSVTGADSGPGGAAGLRYTWTAIHLPGGAKVPTFSHNGINAAQDVLAEFTKAGGYILRCETKNAAGNAATTDISVIVSQTATAMRIEPHHAHTAENSTLQYRATVRDQFNHLMRTDQTIAFRIASGVGSISPAGLFSAGSIAGPVEIEVESDGLATTVYAVVE